MADGQWEFIGRCILSVCFLWMLIGSLIGIIASDGGARALGGLDGLGGDSDLKDFTIAILTLLGLSRLLSSCLLLLLIYAGNKTQVFGLSLVFWLIITISFILESSNYHGINLSKVADVGVYYFAYDSIVLFCLSTAAGICMYFEEKFKVERTMTGSMVRTMGWKGGPSSI